MNIPAFLISNSTLHWKRQGAHGVEFLIRKAGRDGAGVEQFRSIVVILAQVQDHGGVILRKARFGRAIGVPESPAGRDLRARRKK